MSISVRVPELPFATFRDRAQLPRTHGLYFVTDTDERVLYVGKSQDIRARWRQHHLAPHMNAEYRIHWFDVSAYNIPNWEVSEIAAIKRFQPPWNKMYMLRSVKVPDVVMGMIDVHAEDRGVSTRELVYLILSDWLLEIPKSMDIKPIDFPDEAKPTTTTKAAAPAAPAPPAPVLEPGEIDESATSCAADLTGGDFL